MRILDRFIIPQPDLVFYLTANSKTLYERKHEIDIDVIKNQKLSYDFEINLRKNIITIDTSGTEHNTFNKILLKCLEKMSYRYN